MRISWVLYSFLISIARSTDHKAGMQSHLMEVNSVGSMRPMTIGPRERDVPGPTKDAFSASRVSIKSLVRRVTTTEQVARGHAISPLLPQVASLSSISSSLSRANSAYSSVQGIGGSDLFGSSYSSVQGVAQSSLSAAEPGPMGNAKCNDLNSTGLFFRDGREARCPELESYCSNTDFGSRVRDACLKTCGFCDIEEIENRTCFDGDPLDEPVFHLDGKPAHCADLGLFCVTDVSIYSKCKLTCGACRNLAGGSNVSTDSTTNSRSTATRTTDGASCNRRRSLGFCQTRRRRFA